MSYLDTAPTEAAGAFYNKDTGIVTVDDDGTGWNNRCPLLCGRGAISFTNTVPFLVTNISTARSPTILSPTISLDAISSAFD